MYRIAQWLARSALGVGCAVGLVFNLGLTPLLNLPEAQAAPVRTDDTTCTKPPGGLSDAAYKWIDLQCQVHHTLFGAGDSNEPSMTYSFPKAMDAVGPYDGEATTGEPVTFTATRVEILDLSNAPQGAFPPGTEIYVVFGTLAGSEGDIDIFGIQRKGFTAEPDYYLSVHSLAVPGLLNALTLSDKILEGVRFVDRTSNTSMSIAEAQAAQARNPSSLSTDPSIVYCDVSNGFSQGGQIDWACVAQAYADYNEAIADAQAVWKSCMIAAATAAAACIAAAIAALWVNIFLGLGLGALCLIAEAAWMNNCNVTLQADYNAALRTLRGDLAACGVVIVTP